MASDSVIGTTVSHYRVLSRLGAGGMGIVYLAEDVRLKRRVALKFVTAPGDAQAEARLLREAQTASALDHPNIGTVYEVGDWNEQPFIAMAYCPGETLRARLQRGQMSLLEIADAGAQMAAGLAAAHAAGVVHRDLKPANVMLTTSGQVKILDFGLAKALSPDNETMTRVTREGTTVGTLAYMSPEQAQGLEVDHRTDIWSLGAVLYEMLTGRPPFEERTAAAVLLALVSREPQPIGTLRPDTPAELERVLVGAFEKDPARRRITTGEIQDEMSACRARLSGASRVTTPSGQRLLRRPLVGVLLVLILAGLAAAWPVSRWLNQRWATREALPEIQRLADEERFLEAMALAQEARRHIPSNADLALLLATVSRPMSIETTPPGARVSYAAYGVEPSWQHVGETPIRDAPVPRGLLRWRIAKAGFTAFEDATSSDSARPVQLTRAAEAPQGMVPVAGARSPVGTFVNGRLIPGVTFNDFWIDRYEVTNRQYLAFVEAGGYQRPEFWTHPFRRDDITLSWDQARGHFRDQTGRPGPATWVLGRYPHDQEDFPVTGVSWYEAAAYAAYARKQLPTLYEWNHVAAPEELTAAVLPLANIAGQAVLPFARTRALHRFGAYDLAGNVKEWVFNESSPGERYTPGGAWDEPAYLFAAGDARSAWDRQANLGFRCVRHQPGDASVAALRHTILPSTRDYSRETPVRDEVFNAYTRLFSYDRTPVDARMDSVDGSPPDWIRQTVSFPAAYGSERVLAHVFLPKRGRPPFQVAVFVPGSDAVDLGSSRAAVTAPEAAFIVSSGRALVLPIYRGTYERSSPAFRSDTPRESSAFRDHVIDWYKDLARTVDYLETRPDMAADKLAYIGVSRGAALGPVLLALEHRIKVGILYVPGFYAHRLAPEVDVINFAPRLTIPVLVLNGRYDFVFPEKTLQALFFEALGTPAEHKRRVVYETGHNLPRNEMIRETLDWLDKYLGPVK